MKCKNIANHHQSTVILGYEFLDQCAAYTKPINSTKLHIYQVKNVSPNLKFWKINQIKKKMMVFYHENIITAVPIIHCSVKNER